MTRDQALRRAKSGLDPGQWDVTARRVRGRCQIVVTRRRDLAQLKIADAATWDAADRQRRSDYREIIRQPA